MGRVIQQDLIVPFTAGSATDILAPGQKLGDVGPAGDCREQTAPGHDRCGGRGEISTGWVHVAGAFCGAGLQRVDLPDTALRHHQGLRRDLAIGRTTERAHRCAGDGGQDGWGTDRAGEAEAGATQFRVRGNRQRHAYQRGEVQARRWHRRRTHTVQRHARGAERHACRARHLRFSLPISCGAAQHSRRQAARIGVRTSKRSSALPSVPTIAEAGLPGFDYNLWVGMFAPPEHRPTSSTRSTRTSNAWCSYRTFANASRISAPRPAPMTPPNPQICAGRDR